MIPRQVDEPEPSRDRWDFKPTAREKNKQALYAGAWPECDQFELDDLVQYRHGDPWATIKRGDLAYYGLGAMSTPPYYSALQERLNAKAIQTRARQKHLRRQARLAELLRTL